jgi:hypothetical protein
MRLFLLVVLTVTLAASHAMAQDSDDIQQSDAKNWEFSLSVLTYLVPDDREYVQPTVTADHDWLHLEARYNYEDINTGSVWIGYNFSLGDEITLELTPMIGAVFGQTRGVAPGYEVSVSWRNIELYSEGEYVFDTGDSSDSFLYTWTELTISPLDWFRCGLVIERTKLYDTDFDMQHGVLAGLILGNVSLTTYVFNPEDDPVFVLGLGVEL